MSEIVKSDQLILVAPFDKKSQRDNYYVTLRHKNKSTTHVGFSNKDSLRAAMKDWAETGVEVVSIVHTHTIYLVTDMNVESFRNESN